MQKVVTNFKRGQPRHFIRAWRQHRELTQEQLAERVGMTHGAISQLERGEVNYTQPTLEALAEALSCQPADLIMRDPKSPVWSIVDSLRDISESEQKRIISIIEAFRKSA